MQGNDGPITPPSAIETFGHAIAANGAATFFS
jgi:hypothetical protein